uniref:Uncharacterized protein n=2 Tax=Kalanchoe fedtschenkoi TaxID=63787 RepID=A0A7N0UQF6_KALFE
MRFIPAAPATSSADWCCVKRKKMKHSQFIWVDDDNGEQSHEEFQPFVRAKESKKLKTNKIEFVGWGSRQLFDFLTSIGVDTTDKLSQHAVTEIIYKYINAKSLINPNKKKRVVCDEKLQLLFGRKTVGRIKISDLLERHLAENQEETASGDELMYGSDEDDSVTRKRKAISSAEKKSPKKARQAPASNDSCFAEVIPENIKLVYLRKSLVQELSKDPETFDNKVAGTFVRIKSDPNDFTQKNYYQLVRVIGVKRPTGTGDLDKQILLQVSNSTKDISISMLSDDDFSKEECEDVQRRIIEGLLGRLTVVELEQKAQTLHQDITQHWIKRELVLLQRLIDRANEKGWRRELSDYLDRRQLLQTPSEQTRLLQESPKVIAEKIAPELPKETTPEPEPKQKIITEPAEKKYSGDVSDDEDGWLESIIKAAEDARAQNSAANGTATTADPASAFETEYPAAEDQVQAEKTTNECNGITSAKSYGNEEIHNTTHDVAVTVSSEIPAESPKSETNVSFPNNKLPIPNPNLTVAVGDESCSVENPAELPKTDTPISKLDSKLSRPFPNLTVEVKDPAGNAESAAENPKKEMELPKPNEKVGTPQIIELSDDDSEATSDLFCDQPQRPLWQYMDPKGTVQGPFSLLSMKRWSDADYFPSGFMIWKTGKAHVKLALAEVLRKSFSNHQR